MNAYTIATLSDTENAFEKHGWPGEMKHLTGPLGTEQVAITYRNMPQNSGGKGGYGHYHKTQEEVVYLFNGELEVKVDDEVVVLKAGQSIRIAPEAVRSLWNAKPEHAELLIVSTKIDSLDDDTVIVKDFWPV